MIRNVKKNNKFSRLFLFGISLVLLGVQNAFAASCSGCGTYTYVEQSSSNGIVGYCIDPNLPGGLKSASSYAPSAKLTGEILDWAQGFNTAKKQQIAYRLISFENGLGSSVTSTNYKQCILNGCFTSDAEYMEVYNSWKTRTSKKVNQNVSGIIITGGAVTKKDGKFSTTLHVEAGSLTVYLSVDNSRASLSKTEIHGKGDVVVSGTLNDECTGEALVVKATTTSQTTTPGSGCKNTSGSVEFYYYASRPGYQSFIVPVPQGKEIPGKCKGGSGDKNASSTQMMTYEIDIDPEECNDSNCGADISETFTCSGQGKQDKHLYETDNIASCIISGKYKKYCDDGIKKDNDNESKKTKTTDKGDIANIDLGDNNPYCSVYCKEDIDYVLPGEQYAKNGSYFSFKNQEMKITGKRSCYTTKIQTSDYIDDVKEAQQAVLTAYKNLKEAEAKLKSKENATETESSCTVNTNCGGTGTSGKGTWYDGTKEEYIYYTASYDAHGGKVALIPNKGSVEEEWGEKYKATDENCTTGTGKNKKSLTGRTCEKTTVAETIINISEYERALDTAQENLLKVIQNYKSCFEWTNNYCFNPKITYSYDEVYDISGEISSSSDPKAIKSSSEEIYGNKNYTNKVSELTFPNHKSFVYCDKSGCNSQTADLNMTAKFVKKTIEKEKVFTGIIEGKEVCTYHPDGTIFIGKNTCNKEKNTVMLDGDGYVFPVALEHANSKEKYDYQLNISNIGAPGNDTSCDLDNLDRLTGNNCSLYEKTESITTQTGTNYICQYSSCPNCKVKCTCDNYSGTGKCIEKDDYTCVIIEPCEDCPIDCIGCIWSNNDISFGYKQISLSDVFPNDDNKVGYNWNTDANVNPDNYDKSKATIDEIQKEAEEVYTEPEYSYTLTPSTMAKIRAYNEEANKESQSSATWGNKKDNLIPIGGYSNATLTCVNGIQCTSSFLDGLVYEANMKKDEYVRSTEWKVFNKSTGKWDTK